MRKLYTTSLFLLFFGLLTNFTTFGQINAVDDTFGVVYGASAWKCASSARNMLPRQVFLAPVHGIVLTVRGICFQGMVFLNQCMALRFQSMEIGEQGVEYAGSGWQFEGKGWLLGVSR